MDLVFKLAGDRPWIGAQTKTAAQMLVSSIDATGGLVAFPEGTFGCEGDGDWIDLAEAYLKACEELRVPAFVASYETENGVRWPAHQAGSPRDDAAEWAGQHHRIGEHEFGKSANYWMLRYLIATTNNESASPRP